MSASYIYRCLEKTGGEFPSRMFPSLGINDQDDLSYLPLQCYPHSLLYTYNVDCYSVGMGLQV